MSAVYIDNMCAKFNNDPFIPFNALTKRSINVKGPQQTNESENE